MMLHESTTPEPPASGGTQGAAPIASRFDPSPTDVAGSGAFEALLARHGLDPAVVAELHAERPWLDGPGTGRPVFEDLVRDFLENRRRRRTRDVQSALSAYVRGLRDKDARLSWTREQTTSSTDPTLDPAALRRVQAREAKDAEEGKRREREQAQQRAAADKARERLLEDQDAERFGCGPRPADPAAEESWLMRIVQCRLEEFRAMGARARAEREQQRDQVRQVVEEKLGDEDAEFHEAMAELQQHRLRRHQRKGSGSPIVDLLVGGEGARCQEPRRCDGLRNNLHKEPGV